MVVGRGWMEEQGLSDGGGSLLPVSLKINFWMFSQLKRPTEERSSLPHPNKPRLTPLVWISSQFWNVKSIFLRVFFSSSSAERLVCLTVTQESGRVYRHVSQSRGCQIPHTEMLK